MNSLFIIPSGDKTCGFHIFDRAVSLQHSKQRHQDLPCQFCCRSREVSVCRKIEQVLARRDGVCKAIVKPAGNNILLQAARTRLWTSWQGTLTSVPTPTIAFQRQNFQENISLHLQAGRKPGKTLFLTHTHHQ